MSMIVSQRQRIFFRFEGERGAFLVLHHGLFGSHADWYQAGYVEELAREFRLIILDARGHGRSDRPLEKEQYRLELFAADVVAILNEVGIRNVHFLGYSLGALVGFELLRRYPERVRIAFLGGEAPLVTPELREHWRLEAEALRSSSLPEHLARLQQAGRLVRSQGAAVEEQELAPALALVEALQDWEPAPPDRIMINSPLTLFSGAEDPALRRVEAARAHIGRSRWVVFPAQSHAGLFAERQQLTQELLRLLKPVRRPEEGEPRPSGAESLHAPEGQAEPASSGPAPQAMTAPQALIAPQGDAEAHALIALPAGGEQGTEPAPGEQVEAAASSVGQPGEDPERGGGAHQEPPPRNADRRDQERRGGGRDYRDRDRRRGGRRRGPHRGPQRGPVPQSAAPPASAAPSAAAVASEARSASAPAGGPEQRAASAPPAQPGAGGGAVPVGQPPEPSAAEERSPGPPEPPSGERQES